MSNVVNTSNTEFPTPKDVTMTFSESDVTVRHNSVIVQNESIGIQSWSGPSVPNDASTHNKQMGFGLRFTPSRDMPAVRVTLSANTSGVRTVYLSQGDTLLDERTFARDLSPGDSIVLYGPLSANTSYDVGVYDGNDTYSVGRDENATFPVSSNDISVDTGSYGTHPSDGQAPSTVSYSFAFTEIAGTATGGTSGTAYIEWPQPADIYAWGIAQFQRTVDSEQVDIYVEESVDGGSTWTQIAGPISRGTSIPASGPDALIRFRVEFSRSSTANNPTLDMIARSWML